MFDYRTQSNDWCSITEYSIRYARTSTIATGVRLQQCISTLVERFSVKKFSVVEASISMKLELCCFFYFRCTTIVNSCIVWMEVIRTVQAGCGLYVARDTNKSKTCLHSSMT